jgi:glutaconate CoA-transferase subunit A
MKVSPRINDKLMTAKEAVSRFVRDGDQIALGGFTVNRNPVTLIREVIRQGRKNLYLVVHAQGQSMELLIGAGCVSRVELGYGGLARFAPTGECFKRAACAGTIEVEDYTNYHMTLRFLAGAMGLPFVVTPSGLETDIVRKSGFSPEARGQGKVPKHKLKVVANPLEEDEDVVVLPPLKPDVALIHAQYVGEDGTVRIKGLTFTDVEQAKAAEKVLVTCEEIVPAEWIRSDPDQNCLPHFFVDAIVHVPYGAHPTACYQYYDYDPTHLNMFKKLSENDQSFRRYLDEWVFPFETQEDYLAKVGASNLLRIRSSPVVGYAKGLDRR